MDTAVVTGAGRGIGRETARLLTARGYAVLVTDMNEDAARETAEMLGEHAWHMRQDVRDPDRHREVAAAAAERGPLKVWVNNAGILRTTKAWEHTDEEVRALVDANFLGVLWGSRAAVEAMRALGGDIVNMASMSSFGPVPGLAVYGATKHAVLGFTMSLQGDLDDARIPIRTHAICPDGVDTGMVRERAGRGRRGDHLLHPAHAATRGGGREGRERDRRAAAGGDHPRQPRGAGALDGALPATQPAPAADVQEGGPEEALEGRTSPLDD